MKLQSRRQTPAAATSHEWNPVGSGHHGEESGEGMPVEQALLERNLPGSLRVCGSLERLRVHVSTTIPKSSRIAFRFSSKWKITPTKKEKLNH